MYKLTNAEDQNYTHYNLDVFTTEDGEEIAVANTYEEVLAAVKEYVYDTVWAFSSSFLSEQTGNKIPHEMFEALQDQCEGANEAFISALNLDDDDTLTEFAEEAIRYDGEGHFLSQDGEMIVQDGKYIFLLN